MFLCLAPGGSVFFLFLYFVSFQFLAVWKCFLDLLPVFLFYFRVPRKGRVQGCGGTSLCHPPWNVAHFSATFTCIYFKVVLKHTGYEQLNNVSHLLSQRWAASFLFFKGARKESGVQLLSGHLFT